MTIYMLMTARSRNPKADSNICTGLEHTWTRSTTEGVKIKAALNENEHLGLCLQVFKVYNTKNGILQNPGCVHYKNSIIE